MKYGVNMDEIKVTINSLIDSNEELSQEGKFIFASILTKIFDEEFVISFLDTASKAGHNANDTRMLLNDKLMRCRTMALFDDVIPKFCYIGERELRWKDVNIITDIYNEIKVMTIAKYGVSKPAKPDESNQLSKYYDASFLTSLMESIIDSDESLSQADAALLKARIRQHVAAIPEIMHMLLEHCPYTLDNIDAYDASTDESDKFIISSLAEDHPEDSPEFRNKFAQVYNQGIKELLRNYLTDKEQNKGEN